MLKHRAHSSEAQPEVIGRKPRSPRGGPILIADGNYPAFVSKKGPNAEVVSLNLSPGRRDLLAGPPARVLSAVPIDAVNTMMYETTGPYALSEDPPVWDEYRTVIKETWKLAHRKLENPSRKWSFYEAVAHAGSRPDGPNGSTTQSSGSQNILLSIGVR